ncbi:unnamed protein product [Rotaria socialis]|uniref:Uncharacterized protein n=1 Tax=Rotaria socialis TaxID=392032 RepID=A0A819XHK1_9BILA|nr:unnamed protein product [Rotaria socialis]CAF4370816.1 unnamed protein product [Rotaria socialis]CAF4767946.1 unnamed protein product [Rotaria socialis]
MKRLQHSAPIITFVKRNRSLNRTKIEPNPISSQLNERVLPSRTESIAKPTKKKKTSGTSRADLKASSYSNIATCIGSETQYPITSGAVLYPFDGNTRDAFLLPSYNYGAYSGSAILLNATQQQYISIPFIDFRNTSFTLEVWVLPINAATNSGLQDELHIFGQCDGYLTC